MSKGKKPSKYLPRTVRKEILSQMLPPLSGCDRPGEWPRAKFVETFGEQILNRMIKSGLLNVGSFVPAPVPRNIWNHYKENEKTYSDKMKANELYTSNIHYVTFTEIAWIL